MSTQNNNANNEGGDSTNTNSATPTNATAGGAHAEQDRAEA